MNLENYFYVYPNVLSDRFCDEVIKYGTSHRLGMAMTGGFFEKNMNKKQMKSMKKIRTSETCFLNDPWIFKEIKPWIDQANVDARWNFNIDFPEDMQFTKYGLNEFYDWHCDSFAKPFRNHEKKEFDNKIRKISVSCILSRPDEYEGGDFEFDFRNNRKSKNINKISKIERGSVIVFPSFVYHRVQPVTFGTRYSLVIWNLGPSFI